MCDLAASTAATGDAGTYLPFLEFPRYSRTSVLFNMPFPLPAMSFLAEESKEKNACEI